MNGTGTTATGRPRQRVPLILRLWLAAGLGALLLELTHRALREGMLHPAAAGMLHRTFGSLLTSFADARSWAVAHPVLASTGAAVALVGSLVVYRWWLLIWHNEIVARLSGTKFLVEASGFPMRPVDVLAGIARRPPGHYFVGLTPVRGVFGRRWKPVYISQRQRTMHTHAVGKTGSGKTQSVLWPGVLQDMLDGKGVLVMSGKGSDEEILVMKALAALAGRQEQLRILALPAWNQPHLFTHSYNLVYVRPRTPTDSGGDPAATAERVFSVLPLGDNEYYNVQAQVMFGNLCRLLHGLVDASGHGLPFVVRDLLVCFRGIGNVGAWSRALQYCLAASKDREAALAVEAQIRQLGRDVNRCFSGIVGALQKFTAPMVNAYAPDIIFEEVLETNALVYVQCPANLFKVQAAALGKVVLTDVQQEGSLRQVFRHSRNQRPFAVYVDEFYTFADLYVVDSLNKLRDANLEYTLAHQSVADLELVSKEFAQAVWDNTRTKHILNQDNPALCELIAKSVGTHPVVEKTVRVQQGELFTSLTTGDASSKLVEAFRLPPNAIKNLERCGQGYLVNDEGVLPVCYGMLPRLEADYLLPRKDQANARGLRLYERFVAPGEREESASTPTAF